MELMGKILEDLREARRYAGRDTEYLRTYVSRAAVGMALTLPGMLADRLAANMRIAAEFCMSEPEVSRGYVAGAILEVKLYASRENK